MGYKMLWKIRMLLKLIAVKFYQKFPHLISDEKYSKLLYRIVFGRKIDLNNPKTFNEHIIVSKLDDKKYTYAKYTDKYEVRAYVKNKVGDYILNDVYGIYNSFDEIDFDSLPNSFALKATHASGFNIIVTDKKTFDKAQAKKKFDRWLKTNFYYKDREKNYKNISPRILCDKYIEFSQNLVEYKLYCFYGRVKLICQNITINDRRFTNVYDEYFNPIPVKWGYENLQYSLTELKAELIGISEKLAGEFDFVRVDLYENDGKIIFSELTFHSGGGLVPFKPAKYDIEFGRFFEGKK